MTVAEKISKVMDKVNYLKKDGNVSYGRTNYDYLSEEKLTSELNGAFREVGLIITPVDMELLETKEVSTKSGTSYLSRIKATYEITDTEEDDTITITTIGEGMDSGDKGINKAMTAAFKYAQRQSFMIPTGDDPDHTSSKKLRNGNKKSRNEKSGKSKSSNNNNNKNNNKLKGLHKKIAAKCKDDEKAKKQVAKYIKENTDIKLESLKDIGKLSTNQAEVLHDKIS